MKKSLSSLFLVMLMILSSCPLVFGDMAVYSSPQEGVIEVIMMCLAMVFCLVTLFSAVTLFFFIYYYLRNKELSEEFKEYEEVIDNMNFEDGEVVNTEEIKEEIEEIINEESPIYKKVIKDKTEKRLKRFEKLAFMSLYIFGLISCLLLCFVLISNILFDEVISLIAAVGIWLVLFCTSFFSLFVNKKMSKAFCIVYVPIFLIFLVYFADEIFYIF